MWCAPGGAGGGAGRGGGRVGETAANSTHPVISAVQFQRGFESEGMKVGGAEFQLKCRSSSSGIIEHIKTL